MNIYNVTNGYFGNGAVYLTVIANSVGEAYNVASENFKVTALRDNYESDYYLNLEVRFEQEFKYEAQVLCGEVEWNNFIKQAEKCMSDLEELCLVESELEEAEAELCVWQLRVKYLLEEKESLEKLIEGEE